MGLVALVFVLAFIIFLVKLSRDGNHSLGDKLFSCLMVAIFASMFSMFVSLGGMAACDKEWKQVGQAELVSISSGSQVSGSFFIGCGTIDEKGVYYFFKKTDDGGFVKDYVPSDGSVIYEEDRTDGRMEVYKKRLTNDIARFLFQMDGHMNIKNKIYVPKGSIVKQFELE